MVVRFELNLKFLEGFSKNTQMLYFMRTLPVGAELFRVNRRTDMKTLIAVLQVHLITVHSARTVFMCFVFTCVSEHKLLRLM